MNAGIRTPQQLSTELRALRKERGLSQKQLGEKLGLSQERISAIENHPERISVDQFLTILMALNADMSINLRAGAQLEGRAKASVRATGDLTTPPKESW